MKSCLYFFVWVVLKYTSLVMIFKGHTCTCWSSSFCSIIYGSHQLFTAACPERQYSEVKIMHKHSWYSISLFHDMSRTHQAGSHYRVEPRLQGSTVNEAKTRFDGAFSECKQMEASESHRHDEKDALKCAKKKKKKGVFPGIPSSFFCAKWWHCHFPHENCN